MQRSLIAGAFLAASHLALVAGVAGCAYGSSKTTPTGMGDATAQHGVAVAPAGGEADAGCRWIASPVLGPKGGTTFTYKRKCSSTK